MSGQAHTLADTAAGATPGPEPDRRSRNWEVVALGLAWLRCRLEAHVGTLRAGRDATTDGEADWLLRGIEADGAPSASAAETAARRAYDDARAALVAAGTPAAVDRLSARFGLAPFDEDVLLLALAPHVDAAFAALYGYAHDRLALGHPTPHLALALLAPGAARPWALARLAPDAPLRRGALLALDAAAAPGSLAALALDDRVADYLLDDDHFDPRARACLAAVAGGPCPARHRAALEALAGEVGVAPRAAALLVGPRRSGRRAAAQALAARFGLGVAELLPRRLPVDPDARRDRLALVAREARLADLAILVDLSPATRAGADDDARLALDVAGEAVHGLDALLLLVAQERPEGFAPMPALRLDPLDAEDRGALWREALGPGAEGGAIDAVAEQFALGPADVAAAAALSGGDAARAWAACRQVAGRDLAALAERLEPRVGWDDLVVPAAVRDELAAVAAQVRHRARVHGAWGFGRRLTRGRGVSALFAGPSGVGKTMAAEVIAGDLDLDLYRIDLSGVVSKYVGETEKNLKRVFDAAEAAGAVLFFDEADALFGKRSEVKDSHDRYANIEVSYLLQRMEQYGGLAILATNLKSHLDPAFLRRLRHVIDFPFPDAAQRRELWRRAFPAEAPTEGLDLDALARLEIPGGNIAVIAVNAAFLAAAEGCPIGPRHVARAARGEFRKIDKELRLPWVEVTS